MLSPPGAFLLLEENIADSISVSSSSGHSQPVGGGGTGGGGTGGGGTGGGGTGGGGTGGGGLGNNVCRNAVHFSPNSDACC